jgi:hypothetical protein
MKDTSLPGLSPLKPVLSRPNPSGSGTSAIFQTRPKADLGQVANFAETAAAVIQGRGGTGLRSKWGPGGLSGRLGSLERDCAHWIEDGHGRQVVGDARAVLVTSVEAATAVGWSRADLSGFSDKPHPTYGWLARVDRLGQCLLLGGGQVVALIDGSATIGASTGVLTYRRGPR